jgi:hypothetical protein
MRSSVIVAFGALGLITSASAQQVDQNTRQQIERIAAAYVENWNKHDAAGIAALYTNDGVQVTATGVRSGRQENSYALLPIGYSMGRFGPVRRVPLAEVVYEDKWGQLPDTAFLA